jgi:protein-S-isoprenylcysteine O-methyltransferase Ste14
VRPGEIAGMLPPYPAIPVLVVVLLLGASALGMALHGRLIERRKTPETIDHLRLVVAILAIFAAVALALLLSSAKASYDAFDSRVRAFGGSIVELDQRLRQYGEETAPIRANLRAYLAGAIAGAWPGEPRPSGIYPSDDGAPDGVEQAAIGKLLFEVDDSVRKLEPSDPFHAGLANLLEAQVTELLKQRRQAIETAHDTIPPPLLVAMTLWLAIVFGVIGLTAPRNAVVYATILVCGLSFASAIFLILDFGRPLTGLFPVPSEPARAALRRLDTP